MNPLELALYDAVRNTVAPITAETRSRAALQLKDWLLNSAAKIPELATPDVLTMQLSRLDLLANQVEIGLTDGTPVIKASGKAAEVLADLEYGTTWHAPLDDARQNLLALFLT